MLTRGALAAMIVAGLVRPSLADDDAIRRADALFEEGRALLETDFARACAKFSASLEISAHAIGTVLNVALCDEKLGRFASAYARFRDARDRARELDMPAELEAAEEHLAALEGKVPHVSLAFAEPPLPDTRILIDDTLIPVASAARHAVDPGAHEIVVSVPGYDAFTTRFEIAAGEDRTLAIPRLERSVTVRSSRRKVRKAGMITAATGAAALGTGIALGLIARGRHRDASRDHCNTITVDGEDRLQCTADGFQAIESARSLGTIGTVVGGVGVAALGVGAYLWLRGRSTASEERGVSVVPQLGPDGAGVLAVGRF